MVTTSKALAPGKFIDELLRTARTVGELKIRYAQQTGTAVEDIIVQGRIGEVYYDFSDDMPIPQRPRVFVKPSIL